MFKVNTMSNAMFECNAQMQMHVAIEDINRGMKKMSNDKATKIILVTSELFKWTRPQAKQ